VRIRVIDDIITMLNRVGEGRARDDAVLVMAGAYRSYAHHHPGRYSAFTGCRWAAMTPSTPPRPGCGRAGDCGPRLLRPRGDEAFHAALEFWSALHGFVLLEMTGVMTTSTLTRLLRHGAAAAAGLDRRTAAGGASVN